MVHVRQTPYVNRSMVRGAPQMVDGPPASLIPALFALAGATSDVEVAAIMATVPERQRPALVDHMAGRRTFRPGVMSAVLRLVDRDALDEALGELRAASLFRAYS